jgi:hypothetical protein
MICMSLPVKRRPFKMSRLAKKGAKISAAKYE